MRALSSSNFGYGLCDLFLLKAVDEVLKTFEILLVIFRYFRLDIEVTMKTFTVILKLFIYPLLQLLDQLTRFR